MKFRSLENWNDPDALVGLVYFAQLLDELLFDFTIDTYKPSAMNSSTLCLEALSLVADIKAKRIDAKNLEHVFEELIANLRRDEIAKSLYPLNIDSLEKEILADGKPTSTKATHLEVLFYHIRLDTYKEKAEELIAEAIKNGGEKDRIRQLTRAYITTLVSIGYSTRYLKDISTSFFHLNANISDFGDIHKFFEKVSGETQEYRAVFRVDNSFSQIEKPCKAFDLEITKELEPELKEKAEQMSFGLGAFDRFAVVGPIDAKDVFSARSRAQRDLEGISALSNLFHHKEIPKWDDRALMINTNTGKTRPINIGTNPMLMCQDNRPKTAAARLNRFIEEFSLTEERDFSRFFRVTELHALALKSDSPENQLLNLWVALESLVPSTTDETNAKINKIIDSVIPILNLDYIANLSARLVRDFRNWDKTTFESSIHDIPGEVDREKILRLIVLPDYHQEKIALYQKIGNFELLRNRCAYFERALRSTAEIRKLLNGHARRVAWQLRRIYRTRNLIVHTGRTPPFVDALIRNIHDYLDVVVSTIVHQASDGEKINSIDQTFAFATLKYKEFEEGLKVDDIAIDSENIERYLISIKIRV